jgi:sugar (pentulose or hexulose) kinase
MNKAPTILAIDNGTQSVRALVFDLEGNLLAKSRVPIPEYQASQPGWSELEPDLFWQTVCQACQKLWQMDGVDKESLVGVALTTQRSTVINLDKDGQPLRPAITWMDNRRTYGLKPVSGLWGVLFALAGMTETAAYLQAEAECNWISTEQPEIWEKTDKYLLLSGYLTYRLTGRLADSVGCQVAYIPFDYKSLTWAGKMDWKWQAVPMRREILPDLVPPTGEIGKITHEAAAASGIPVGLPLIAAAADKACEVIGAGCLEPNVACISYGTSATINTTHTKYAEVIPLIPPYPSAVPNAYNMEAQIYRGYWMVSWFKQEFGALEERIATERGMAAEAVFEESVRKIPAGSMGLVLQPYWSPGLKIPGPEAKGAVIGFGDVHQRAHLYRAIQEGLGYALRDGAERTERSSHIKITEIRVAGGGSQSDVAMQLTADIFGLAAAKPHVYEASGLGAAIDAAVGLKLYPDFGSAVKSMTRIGKVFEPDAQAHKIYDELYKKVYSKMYSRLKPLYEDIRRITGYPPGYD